MTNDRFLDKRNAMVVSQLRPNGVSDPRVLDAMGRVPREDFVSATRRETAYADTIINDGDDHAMNSPMVTGRLLNEANIGVSDRVLVVGDAADYTVAIVRILADSVVQVAAKAAAHGAIDGLFDVIVVDGAIDQVPDVLIDHLSPSGRLVTGIVENGVTRLAVGHRGGTGFGLVAFADADMIIVPEFASSPAFVF